MKKAFLAAAAVSALLATSPALADDSKAQNATVTYEDLDLSTEEGRKELDERIKIAARRSCDAGRHTTGTRSNTREERRCVSAAIKRTKSALAPIVEEQRLGG